MDGKHGLKFICFAHLIYIGRNLGAHSMHVDEKCKGSLYSENSDCLCFC